MSRTKITVFSGPPCSGKSTLAGLLARRTGWPHLQMDEVRKRLIPKSSHTPEDRQLAYRAMHLLAETLLENGHDVILDATYGPVQHRQELELIAARTRSDLYLIECRVRPEDAVARFTNRPIGHAATDLTPERVRELAKTFIFSHLGIEVNTAQDPDLCIRIIESYLAGATSVPLGRWASN